MGRRLRRRCLDRGDRRWRDFASGSIEWDDIRDLNLLHSGLKASLKPSDRDKCTSCRHLVEKILRSSQAAFLMKVDHNMCCIFWCVGYGPLQGFNLITKSRNSGSLHTQESRDCPQACSLCSSLLVGFYSPNAPSSHLWLGVHAFQAEITRKWH